MHCIGDGLAKDLIGFQVNNDLETKQEQKDNENKARNGTFLNTGMTNHRKRKI